MLRTLNCIGNRNHYISIRAGEMEDLGEIEEMIHRDIDGHSIINTLIEEVASLRAINKDSDARFAVLQATIKDKEHITKCKPVDPDKFQERRKVHIHAWLDAMENYLLYLHFG